MYLVRCDVRLLETCTCISFLKSKTAGCTVSVVTGLYPHTIGQYATLAHMTEVYDGIWRIRLIEIVGESFDVQFEFWPNFVLQNFGC